MSNLPELPDEIIEKIISMVDDVDIRRYFGVYNKIDIGKYKLLEKLIPSKIFYQWSCKEDCPEDCERHEYPYEHNPIINPIVSNHYSSFTAKVWKMVNNKWKLLDRSPKTVGKYNVYDIKYNLPNIIEGDVRLGFVPLSDIAHLVIHIYNDCVSYEIEFWKVKKRCGDQKNPCV